MIEIKCNSTEKENILKNFKDGGFCPFSIGCRELPINGLLAGCEGCEKSNIKWIIDENHYDETSASEPEPCIGRTNITLEDFMETMPDGMTITFTKFKED